MTDSVLLEAVGVSKSFGPVRALAPTDMALRAGTVLTLAGENGSGKSTLIKTLAGVHAPDTGKILVDGRALEPGSVRAARAAGMALVTQEGSLLPDLSVAENILLGHRQIARRGVIDWGATRRAAKRVLDRLALDLDPGRSVRTLAADGRQLVEIARAISYDARALLLDEATSSLDQREVASFFEVLRRLRDDGVGIAFVSHRMAEMLEISDYVAVLRDGEHVADAAMADVDEAWLVRSMVGRDVTVFAPRAPARTDDVPALDVASLSDQLGRVNDVSLTVHPGEIVGLAGLVGAGRTELLETIIGARGRASGEVRVQGEPLRGGPNRAIRSGVVLLTDDRQAKGAVPTMTVGENMLLGPDRSGLTVRRRGAEAESVAPWMEKLRVRASSSAAPIVSLSGGNQQKVLLGRCLITTPNVILLDEPTRGIDIGAKTEIGALVGELADRGAAILMASSELAELLAVSTRVLVMRGGRIVADLDRAELSEEILVSHALGAGDAALA